MNMQSFVPRFVHTNAPRKRELGKRSIEYNLTICSWHAQCKWSVVQPKRPENDLVDTTLLPWVPCKRKHFPFHVWFTRVRIEDANFSARSPE